MSQVFVEYLRDRLGPKAVAICESGGHTSHDVDEGRRQLCGDERRGASNAGVCEEAA